MVWGHFLDTYTLVAIMRYKMEHDGNSPTVGELAERLNFHSTELVNKHLKTLYKAGLLERRDGKLCVTPLAYKLYAEETPYAVPYPQQVLKPT